MSNFEKAFKDWQERQNKQKSGKFKKMSKEKTVRGLLNQYFGDKKI